MQARTLHQVLHHSRAMEPIRLDALADFLEHKHGLSCWCPGCRRSAKCNLVELDMRG